MMTVLLIIWCFCSFKVFTAPMKVLLGIILLSCVQSVVNENVDINTLSRIQRFFNSRYDAKQNEGATLYNKVAFVNIRICIM